ncbi:nucleotide disphospho-sugar-binding domain-containing protein [Amycolatopsis sp. YIM 10]|uniref:nucleotide disphospho-sugar-binding domain-containing protein n=1 Tax=Amycolatopsis sp. YIM 10 TaxID=2653857 RepID=UPI001883EFA8|nr:nucleotide disphospho-sugar-binding domain-containing protein [Amycolatopsis sp. YIM 10]
MSTHLTEMVPICWALRSAGHEVLVAGDPDIRVATLSAGLNFAEIGKPVDLSGDSDVALSPDLFPVEAMASRTTEEGRIWWEECAKSFVPHAAGLIGKYLELAEDWQPDLVLVDSMSLLGWLLGAAVKAPAVHYHACVVPLTGPFEEKSRELLAPVCEELGLPGLTEPDLVLDPVPASLQAVDARPGVKIRYLPYNGTGVLPDWVREPKTKPRVCVTFGSVTAMTGPRPFRAVMDALEGIPESDAEIVVTLSPANRKLLGPFPEHVRVAEYLPLNLFLESCDLVIHHGGTATGMTAAALGVPVLVLPQWGNSFDYGQGLADAGAGVSLASRAEQEDVAGIRKTITTMLTDPSFKAAAAKMRAEMEAAVPQHRVAHELGELAAGRPAFADER